MNESLPSSPRRRWRWIAVIVLIVLATAAIWFGHRQWQARAAEAAEARAAAAQQLAALQRSVDALRRDQRANARAIQDAAATNRVLRDEILGLGQRNALLEANLAQLADSSRSNVPSLRREEAELLLSQAQQRLEFAGDVEGARRLYALAAGALESIDLPGYLDLRQALMQERNALDALGPGIVPALDAKLLQFADALQQLPDQAPGNGDAGPWWQQLLSPLVQIRPTQGDVLVSRSERIAAQDSLQVELSLARAALARGDSGSYRRALTRVDGWLLRLWPDSPARRQHRAELDALRDTELKPTLPELGSTLQQLRAMRDGRTSP